MWRALLLLLGVGVAPLEAQQEVTSPRTDSATVRPLTLLLQPGMLSADFLSAPERDNSTTGFNLRFATLVPTASRWVTLIVGGSVTPYGTSGISFRNHNGVMLFAGNVFPGFPASRTGGWLSLELPLLVTYSFGGGGPRNRDLYGKDVVAEAAFSLHIGSKLLRELGPAFSRWRIYLLIDQLLTPNEDQFTGAIDRFNPVAQYGITIPLGGRRGDR